MVYKNLFEAKKKGKYDDGDGKDEKCDYVPCKDRLDEEEGEKTLEGKRPPSMRKRTMKDLDDEAKTRETDFLKKKKGEKKKKMDEEVEIAEELLEEADPEQTKPSLEEVVKTILDEEGGAADLEKIEEKLRDKDMEVPMDLEEKLEDMENVMRHKKGDYIEMSGLKEENPDMMLPAE